MDADLLHRLFRYEDGKLIRRTSIKARRGSAGQQAGSINHTRRRRYLVVDGLRHPISHFIWIMHYGAIPEGMEIDHINRDSLDDRIGNLRLATHNQNCWNRMTPGSRATGVKGAYWHKSSGKWQSRIKVSGRTLALGYFPTKEQAAEAYRVAAEALHGEFASTR